MSKPGDPRSTRRYKTIRAAVIAESPECVICGTDKNLTADHIIPVSLGDEESWYDPNNMQVMCMTHNGQKSNKTAGTAVQINDWINPKWVQWERDRAA